MQSTRSASTIAFRISPSPDWFDDIEPLASTKPAMPVVRQVVDEVLHPREIGVGGRKACQRPSVCRCKQQFAAPVAIVERRVGQHIIGLEVGVLLVGNVPP